MFALQKYLSQKALSREDDSHRLFHGRGHTYPGWEWLTIDWFAPVVMATLFKPPSEEQYETLKQSLEILFGSYEVDAVYIQHRYSRDADDEWLGEKPEEALYARRKGLRFELDLGSRQNTGYFLDMEPGRQWLEQQPKGTKGLNLFAYTCALSAVALAAEAREVINIDMSKSALATGQKNHQLNNLKGGRFQKMDVFKSWRKLAKTGPFDWIVLDPPSYQPGSFIAAKDYGRLVKHLGKVVSPGTEILACLNAPELDSSFLKQCFEDNLPTAQFIMQLAGDEAFPEAEPEKGLKCLVFKVS